MSATYLQITAPDPIVARDGRPFGVGQGQRMRGLSWLLPSVVAGSFRTALVKAHSSLDFSGSMPSMLLSMEVAGVFPVAENELYLPAPYDAVLQEHDDANAQLHRVIPLKGTVGGCDFPRSTAGDTVEVCPVMLSAEQATEDFKPAVLPAWWPLNKIADWLVCAPITLDRTFLMPPRVEVRDHVKIDGRRGAAEPNRLFATAGLNMSYLPRYKSGHAGGITGEGGSPDRIRGRFAAITLTARVANVGDDFSRIRTLSTWHPLGGERRLVHWKSVDMAHQWQCPQKVQSALAQAKRVRMVLATPAIFDHGWRPEWLNAQTLQGRPFPGAPEMKLVGINISRWKAVSGWSLQPLPETNKPGPKPIRRMVPAGSVYYFETSSGMGSDEHFALDGWLRSVSDRPQDRNDGFGLAVWGTW